MKAEPASLHELLRSGHRLHKAGDAAAAEAVYRRILDVAPGHPDALHSLGLLAHQAGWHEQALGWVREAIGRDGRRGHYHNTLGLVLRALGRFGEAAECFEQALAVRPDYPVALKNLARIRAEQGRDAEAETFLNRALGPSIRDADAAHQLGLTLRRQGKPEAAERALRRAVEIDPAHAGAWNDLGALLKSAGRDAEAVDAFRRAAESKPGDPQGWHHLAVALCEAGDLAAAEDTARRAMAADPGGADGRQAMGLVCYRLGRFGEALAHLRAALEREPGTPTLHNNLGAVFRQCGELEAARGHFEAALRAAPDKPDARLNLALVLLTAGEFRRGWVEYEWRRRQPRDSHPVIPRPLWDGGPLGGRRILLYAEQGFGDTLQFVRYAPLVKRRGGHVTLACQPALMPLLSRSAGIDELVPLGQPAGPAFDVYAPLLSLPGIFGTDLTNLPAAVPYVAPDAGRVERWRQDLKNRESLTGFRVGIGWQGSPKYADDRQRSLPLRHFAPLADVPGVRLISLQKGHGTEQIGRPDAVFPLHVFGEDFDSEGGAFMDTAAVMQSLDLVVTSDTALAHLSGALGVPTWVVLPLVADWRWLLEREDCPWYPTTRLFRQHTVGDWTSVFERVRAELEHAVAAVR
jgi:Flp pilus assembly protein TadD